jgi:hypothetical protein
VVVACLLKHVGGLGLALPLQLICQHGQMEGETLLLLCHLL